MKKILLYSFLALALSTPAMAQFSIPKVVFEEFTGAWCQYCADGAYRAETMDANYPDALMIAVHNADAMSFPQGDSLDDYYAPAYPNAIFNRNGALVNRGVWSSTMSGLLQGASIVTVSFDNVAYDFQSRTITADVRALFTGPASGDLRINLAVTEREVTGTGSGYNQVNFDNTTPGHPYFGLGNPIVGFVHKHVGRAYVGGTWGVSGIIPNTVNFGTAVTHTFTYVLPANFDETKIDLVAMVGRVDGTAATDRPILNGEEFDLSTLTVGRPEVSSASPMLEIHGNPLRERSKIMFTTEEAGSFRLEVLNMLGQQVALLADGYTDQGVHTVNWDGMNAARTPVDNGMYLVRLVTESGQTQSQRMLIAR